jgi:hypothetical protein
MAGAGECNKYGQRGRRTKKGRGGRGTSNNHQVNVRWKDRATLQAVDIWMGGRFRLDGNKRPRCRAPIHILRHRKVVPPVH